MQSVTVPYPVIIGITIAVTILALFAAALIAHTTSVCRAQNLSHPSPLTKRSNCPRPGCQIVHPRPGRHRADPRPAGTIDVFVSAFFCGFGLFTVPKGSHYRY